MTLEPCSAHLVDALVFTYISHILFGAEQPSARQHCCSRQLGRLAEPRSAYRELLPERASRWQRFLHRYLGVQNMHNLTDVQVNNVHHNGSIDGDVVLEVRCQMRMAKDRRAGGCGVKRPP